MPPNEPQIYASLRHPADGETSLYLVRHGRTASNVQRVFHGVTDVPLDTLGIRQAHLLAARLRADVGADALVSSPLQRALATARIIGDGVGLAPVVVPGLIEVNFGELEGAPIATLLTDYPDVARRLLGENDADAAWPGGESRRGFFERVWTTFGTILDDYAGRTVIAVAHGGVIGSFLAQIQGIPANQPAAYDVRNCSVTHLVVTPRHTAIHCYNDVVHLDGLADGAARAEEDA